MFNVTKQFFDVVWKNCDNLGWLVLSALKKNSKPINEYFKLSDSSGIKSFLNENINTYNIYSSLGLQNTFDNNNARGKESGVSAIPGFAVDIDIKGSNHKEQNLPPDYQSAMDVIMSLPIKPTMIISSGGGFYPYYLFKDPIKFDNDDDRKQAKLLSKSFQKYIRNEFNKYNWKLDSTHTLERLFRLPGTLNHKNDNPTICKIIDIDLNNKFILNDFEQFQTKTINKATKHISAMILQQVPVESNQLIPDDKLMQLINECAWLRHIKEDARTLSEPEWFHSMSILTRFENGQQIIHEWSQAYPGYSHRETQNKINRSINNSNPVTCDYICDELGFNDCKNCKHYNDIKSPISLALIEDNSSSATEEDQIDIINKSFAVVNYGGKVKILKEYVDPITNSNEIEFCSVSDFKNLMRKHKIPVFTENGVKSKDAGSVWMESKDRREYGRVIFYPGSIPSNDYNLWTGFNIEPSKGNCDTLLHHIFNNIANKNEIIYEYIINWLAHLVQYPHEKIGTALVLKGERGTGKGTFCKVLEQIFGKHYIQLANSSHLTGKFNKHLQDKLVVFADEAICKDDKQSESIIKMLITENNIVIEPKGVDSFTVKNYCRLIIASNNDWIVPAGVDERRFVAIEVGNEFKQNHQYFHQVHDELNNGGASAFLEYLLSIDISNYNLRLIPKTNELFNQKYLSMDHYQKFWFQKLKDADLFDPERWNLVFPCEQLFNEYQQFAKELGLRSPGTKESFGKALMKICPIIEKQRISNKSSGRREYCYSIPALEECRYQFEVFVDSKIDWDE